MKAGIAALLLVGSVALGGCGSSVTLTAAEEAPALKAALTSVDSDLAHGQYLAARTTLTNLIANARAAQRAGTLSAAAATKIIASAQRLLALLPKPAPVVKPTPKPTPTPAPVHREPRKHEGDHKPGKKHGH